MILSVSSSIPKEKLAKAGYGWIQPKFLGSVHPTGSSPGDQQRPVVCHMVPPLAVGCQGTIGCLGCHAGKLANLSDTCKA